MDDDGAALLVEAHHHDVVVAPTAHVPGHDQRPAPADEVPQVRHVAAVRDGLHAAPAREIREPGAGDAVQLGREQRAGHVVVGDVVAPVPQYHGQRGGTARIPSLSDEGHVQAGSGEDRDQGEDHLPAFSLYS